MKVKTKPVAMHAYSISGYHLPTFQEGRLRKVYNNYGFCIRKYICFTYIETFMVPGLDILSMVYDGEMRLPSTNRLLTQYKQEYKRMYLRVK